MVRRNLAEVLTGLVVLIAAAGFLAYAVANSGRNPVGVGYSLYARFNNIAGLAVGSDVRLAGVKIGAVDSESIDPKTFLADVRMTIRNGIELPKDSSIEVASESSTGRRVSGRAARRGYRDVAAGPVNHHHPGGGQPAGPARQVHLQRDEYGERDDRQREGRQPAGAEWVGDPGSSAMMPPPSVWPQPDGTPVSCREKLKMLSENHAELAQALQDTFEDAVMMGVDEQAMRRILLGMVDALESPKRARV